jgi:hypothetical protein
MVRDLIHFIMQLTDLGSYVIAEILQNRKKH